MDGMMSKEPINGMMTNQPTNQWHDDQPLIELVMDIFLFSDNSFNEFIFISRTRENFQIILL